MGVTILWTNGTVRGSGGSNSGDTNCAAGTTVVPPNIRSASHTGPMHCTQYIPISFAVAYSKWHKLNDYFASNF